MIRLATYNVKWFDDLFTSKNELKTGAETGKRLDAIADAFRLMDADFIGLVEGPNSGGAQSGPKKVQAFAKEYGLRTRKALIGVPSQGRQEIIAMYDPDVVAVTTKKGRATARNPAFDQPFEIDSDDDGIREIYRHYRPPLEVEATSKRSGRKLRIIVVHIKSKGIFSNMDRLNWERASRRNRLKIIAEATSVRRRVDAMLRDGDDVVVMGDVNDGPGMDYYEFRYAKSGVELIMGDAFDPDAILRNYAGKPTFGRFGWTPSSARFVDQFTEKPVNVLIDHILVSKGVKTSGETPHRVWNPFEDDEAGALKEELRAASDHFPISLDIRD
ncbi:MAG: endonuclease/exonuclease/phosphatase family protein [Pseudomonadota bacterium]